MAKLSRIAPEIPVSDLPAAIEFYEKKLGFHLEVELPSGHYAIVQRDHVAIHLFRDDAQTHTPIGVHIFTQELDELFDELQKRGPHIVQGIIRKPWGNRDFRVRDLFGNELKFTAPLDNRERE